MVTKVTKEIVSEVPALGLNGKFGWRAKQASRFDAKVGIVLASCWQEEDEPQGNVQ